MNIEDKYPSGEDIIREREYQRKKLEREFKAKEEKVTREETPSQEDDFPIFDEDTTDIDESYIIEIRKYQNLKSSLKLPYLEGFRNYMKTRHPDKSFNNCLDNLKSMDYHFFIPLSSSEAPSPFEMLSPKNILSHPLKDVIGSLYDWKAVLDCELKDPKFIKHTRNRMGNWMSSYTLFIFFIEDYFGINDIHNEDSDSKAQDNPNSIQDSEKEHIRERKKIYIDTLKATCIGKLQIQDRMSFERKANLPIYYLSEIIKATDLEQSEKDFINNWIKSLCSDIIMLAQKGDKQIIVPIERLQYIQLYKDAPASLKLNYSDLDATLLTRTADDKICPMYINRENQIYINFEPSLNKILKEYEDNFPALSRFSDIVKYVAACNDLDATDTHNSVLAAHIKDDPKILNEIVLLWPEIKKDFYILRSKIERLELRFDNSQIS